MPLDIQTYPFSDATLIPYLSIQAKWNVLSSFVNNTRTCLLVIFSRQAVLRWTDAADPRGEMLV